MESAWFNFQSDSHYKITHKFTYFSLQEAKLGQTVEFDW